MERIFVFSDLHGDVQSLQTILSRIDEEKADYLFFTGDLGIERLGTLSTKLRHLPIPTTLVRGNCDSIWSFSEAEFPVPTQYAIEKLGSRTIFLTHGHLITHWKIAPYPLTSEDIFITGHSHRIQLAHSARQPILLNPGSASSPRDKNPPSYAVVTSQDIFIKALATGKILMKMHLE